MKMPLTGHGWIDVGAHHHHEKGSVMVVLGCNPEWQAVSWLAPEPVNRSRIFPESWLSHSDPATHGSAVRSPQTRDLGLEEISYKA